MIGPQIPSALLESSSDDNGVVEVQSGQEQGAESTPGDAQDLPADEEGDVGPMPFDADKIDKKATCKRTDPLDDRRLFFESKPKRGGWMLELPEGKTGPPSDPLKIRQRSFLRKSPGQSSSTSDDSWTRCPLGPEKVAINRGHP